MKRYAILITLAVAVLAALAAQTFGVAAGQDEPKGNEQPVLVHIAEGMGGTIGSFRKRWPIPLANTR